MDKSGSNSKQSPSGNRVLKQIQMPQWTKKRIDLVGDACTCLSPLAGQGASMAMLEAFVLSNELKRSGNVEEGLRCYETILKPDIASRQIQAKHTAKRFGLSSVLEMAWYR